MGQVWILGQAHWWLDWTRFSNNAYSTETQATILVDINCPFADYKATQSCWAGAETELGKIWTYWCRVFDHDIGTDDSDNRMKIKEPTHVVHLDFLRT